MLKIIKITEKAHSVLEGIKKTTGVPISFTASKAIEDLERPISEEPKEDYKVKKKPVKKTHPYFNSIKEIYIEAWESNNGVKYTSWGVVDATATNKLIRQLESINESKQPVNDLFRVIIDKLPNFYKDKSINAIAKNLSSIIAEIKNGNKKDSKGWDNIPEQFDWRK